MLTNAREWCNGSSTEKDGVSDEIIDQDIGSTILEMMRAASVGTESEAYGGSITAMAYSQNKICRLC